MIGKGKNGHDEKRQENGETKDKTAGMKKGEGWQASEERQEKGDGEV